MVLNRTKIGDWGTTYSAKVSQLHTQEKLNLERRLNVLLYLNKDWQEDYGGHFEMWCGKTSDNGDHYLTECVDRILPLFNRFVVFSTSETSYHGHPDPLLCPEDRSRKSLALYYYTVDRPEIEQAAPHSTIFVQRPQHVVEQAIDPGYSEPKSKLLWQLARAVRKCCSTVKSMARLKKS
ncbi:MAG: hypothetical protein GY821_01880 [Gammaproteobacteria bacterium]|nr:hypothetical protein [Gammaproteobacteria bacterium]